MNINKNLKSIVVNVGTVALAVALGVPLGNYIKETFSKNSSVQTLVPITLNSSSDHFKNVSEDLIVYGDTRCKYCKEGIAMLDKRGIKYKVYYIDQNPSAKKAYSDLNTGGVPVLVSKRQYMSGFNEDAWTNFLATQIN